MRNASAALFCVCSVFSSGAFADPDLDPTWDPPGGYTVTPTGFSEALPRGLALDSIGRVVLAGYSYPIQLGNPQFTAIRYVGDNDPNLVGFEDAGFKNGSQDGVANVAVGYGPAYGHAVQIGAADGVVVAGDCEDNVTKSWAFCLARFNSNGAVDTSWGNHAPTDGTTTSPYSIEAYAKAMTTDSTGSFLVAGYSYPSGPAVFTVARYNGSGFQDMGFGGSGFATTANPATGDSQAFAIAVDSDGNIVVAGTTVNATYPMGRFAVTRLTSTGLPDPTFNGGNMLVIDMGGGVDGNYLPQYQPNFGITIDASNRPIIVGTVYPSMAPSVIGIVRLTTAGALDSTFGSGGKVVAALTDCSNATPSGVQVDGSGSLFVSAACTIPSPAQSAVALVHYTPGGHVDTAYRPNGYNVEAFGSSSGGAAVLLDYRGRPVVAAYDYRPSNNNLPAFLVFRHDFVYSSGFE